MIQKDEEDRLGSQIGIMKKGGGVQAWFSFRNDAEGGGDRLGSPSGKTRKGKGDMPGSSLELMQEVGEAGHILH